MVKEKFNGIILKECGAAITEADIDAELGRKFPGSDYFYEFYKTYNGGFANKNTTHGDYSDYGDYLVRIINFHYIKDTPNQLLTTIGRETLRFREAFIQETLFDNAIIFTNDEGGNPVFIDCATGAVFYMAVDDGLYEKKLLGKDFEHFLLNLDLPTRVWAIEDPAEVRLVEGYETWWNELP